MTKILEAKNLTKTFPNVERQILTDVSLKIDEGDFISILGESGSGKSTLLSILGGMDKPDSGEVFFEEKSLTSLSEKELAKLRRTKLGFVFQFFNLAPYLTVEENIILPMVLDNKSSKEYNVKFRELVEYLRLGDLLKKMPNKLSGGEQQRVAIARGLIYQPKIIYLDEPTGNLDSNTAIEIMELLKNINTVHKTTILQVTHSENNALYGNKLIRIKDGKIFEELVLNEEIVEENTEEPQVEESLVEVKE